MHTDFLAEINEAVEDASKNISERVIIKDLSKQLRDEVVNYTPVFCGELANCYVFGESCKDFDSSLSKESLTRIFQLYVTPLVEKMVMDLLGWEFPHIQRPEHRDTSDTKGIISDPSLNTSGTNLESAKVETSDNKTSRTEPSLNSSASAEENPNTGTNPSELTPPEQPDHLDF